MENRVGNRQLKENRKGKIFYASQMQRAVHLASYFLQFEFLIAICLSHLISFLISFFFLNILLMRNWNNALERKMADRFPELPGSD